MSARLRPSGLVALALVVLALPLAAQATERVGDLVTTAGNIPRRLIGYGLVIGLEGTGDRSFGSATTGGTQTVRSIANALRRFGLEVPGERLRPRNVAAVVVTAEASPWLRAGGRFEVQVSSIGDATSLRGGVLWITPLQSDPEQPPVATAQGSLYVPEDDSRALAGRRGNSARIPDGGVLEVEPPQVAALTPKLLLRRPSLTTAQRLASAINAGLGDSVAKVDDPGSITLNPGARGGDNLAMLLAAIDTLPVRMAPDARVVIDARSGTVVSGGTVRVAAATVTHRGLTLRIGGAAPAAPADSTAPPVPEGLLTVGEGASVQEVAAGLHAAGAKPQEIAAMFSALREVGALSAEVVVR